MNKTYVKSKLLSETENRELDVLFSLAYAAPLSERKYDRYVALSRFTDKVTKYLIDGVEATPAQLEDIMANYIPKPSGKPCLVPWRTYGLDSLVTVEACV